jgi:hypothetical protein
VPTWATYPNQQANWTDTDYVRGQNLYSYEDPNTAMDSFFRDSGVNPYAANPFTQTMRRAAAPLGTAYASEWARQGQPGSTQWNQQDPLREAMNPYSYATYLGSAFGNTDQVQGRGVFGTLRRGMEQLPSLINAIRGLNADTSGDITNVNPFLASMAERMAEDNGMGTVNYMSQLASPLMSPALRQAYRNQLMQRQSSAVRAQMNAGDPMAAGNDIWRYLLGQ